MKSNKRCCKKIGKSWDGRKEEKRRTKKEKKRKKMITKWKIWQTKKEIMKIKIVGKTLLVYSERESKYKVYRKNYRNVKFTKEESKRRKRNWKRIRENKLNTECPTKHDSSKTNWRSSLIIEIICFINS